MKRGIDETPSSLWEAEEVVGRDRLVHEGVVILHVDGAADHSPGPQKAEALDQDRVDVAPRYVLERVGARHLCCPLATYFIGEKLVLGPADLVNLEKSEMAATSTTLSGGCGWPWLR